MRADESHSIEVAASSQGAEPPWELIAERIDAFAAAWDRSLAEGAAAPPALDSFAAGLSVGDARAVLLELVKLDLERRWQHDRQPLTAEQYAAQLPQLGPVENLPVDLLYEEMQARMLAGRAIYQEEIYERFPRQAESLLRLLGGMAVSGSPTATYFADTVQDEKRLARPQSLIAAFAALKPGDQVDDFQLIAPLGSGAFARVFLARQVSMERMVALKVSAAVGSEPQTLAQLDHPHIVRVYDQRQCVDPPARLLYMEVVSGGTLQDAISKMRNAFDGKPDGMLLLSSIDERLGVVGAARPEASSSRDWIEDATWPETTAKLGAEMAEGLAYAHSRGVLHRDLKPANVLLTAEAKPKLADFNVSFNGGRADENPEDTFGGSLAYMSPEQLEACHPLLGGSPRNVRAASDVYALGVMLWELLTGRRPFRDELAPADGGQLVKLQRMIETRRRTDFGKLTAELPWNCPQSLRDVLAKCLAPEAAERFASADELARSLRLCLNPRCYELLQAPTTRRGRFAVHWPILAVVLAGLIPNLLTAAFNFSYNKSRIASMDQGVIDRFNVVQMWINGLAFPIGVGLGAWGALRAFTALRRRDVAATAETSGHMLLFGRFISAMLLAVWSVSGLAFPIAVGWGENVPNPLGFHLHFISSLALSGCASTAYPYFLITWLATRYFVPALVRQGKISGPLRGDLKRVAWWNRFHLGVAALVPMLGMFVVVMFADFQRDDPNWWVLPVVSGGGLLGFGAMMWLDRQIAQDSAALEHIAVVESRGPGGRASGRGSRSGTARRTGA